MRVFAIGFVEAMGFVALTTGNAAKSGSPHPLARHAEWRLAWRLARG